MTIIDHPTRRAGLASAAETMLRKAICDEADRRALRLEELVVEAVRLQDYPYLERLHVVAPSDPTLGGLPGIASWIPPAEPATGWPSWLSYGEQR